MGNKQFFCKLNVILFSTVLLVILLGCTSLTGYAVQNNTNTEQGEPIQLIFCPGKACETALIGFMNKTTSTLDCAFYDLDLPSAVNTLDEISKRARVRIVVDDDNKIVPRPYISKDTSSQLSHNKFCIRDGSAILTGSMNPTYNDLYKNNNNLLIIPSRILAENYAAEFEELKRREFGSGGPTPHPTIQYNNLTITNAFCPEDHCANKINEELQKATSNITFAAFTFTHDGIGKTLAHAQKENISVQGIFEKRQNSQYCEKDYLEQQGCSVRFDNNNFTMHHKFFIIDEKTVITGSFNPTKAADTKNDENIIIIHDAKIAQQFMQEYARIP